MHEITTNIIMSSDELRSNQAFLWWLVIGPCAPGLRNERMLKIIASRSIDRSRSSVGCLAGPEPSHRSAIQLDQSPVRC